MKQLLYLITIIKIYITKPVADANNANLINIWKILLHVVDAMANLKLIKTHKIRIKM